MLLSTTPSAQSHARTINRIGWALVIFRVLFSVCTGLVEGVFAAINGIGTFPVATAIYGILASVAYMAPFILTGVIFYAMSTRTRPAIPVERIRFDRRLPAMFPLLVMAGLAINLVASYANFAFCEVVGYVAPADTGYPFYDTPGGIILYMTTALAPAFSEEFLFRGVVYGTLRPYGRTQALLISSLTFALMHENLSQLFYTFIAGILLALMYEWTGSIWCSVLFHLFNNEFAVINEILYGKFGEDAASLVVLIDVILMALGAASILVLLLYANRKRKKNDRTLFNGLSSSRCGEEVEAYDMPLRASTVGRSMRTPGMIVYICLTAATILLGYVTVLLDGLVGGI